MQEFILNEAKKFALIVNRGSSNYSSLKKLQIRFEEELLPFSDLTNRLSFINSFEDEVTDLFRSHLEKCDKIDSCPQHLTFRNSEFLVKQEREKIQTLLSNTIENIFQKGEFFDSYKNIVDIINLATVSIKLIDNYVDQNTLDFFTHNENNSITIKILTKSNSVTTSFNSFIEKFNRQYGDLKFKTSEIFHDRFLIIDDAVVYMIGASLKDIGKKIFMINKVEGKEMKKLIISQFENEWNKF
jgi:hypothetical protein